MKTQILVCCHKPDSCIRKNEIYEPIQVGKTNSCIDLGYKSDNETIRGGGNISHKNKNYCEITALYWMWKEMTPVDYVGLAHYRRYFKNLSKDKVCKILHKYEIITCTPVSHFHSNFQELCHWIGVENVYLLFDDILSLNPEYINSIIKYGYKSNSFIPCNMFVSSWEWMQCYSEWLFPILEKVEKRMKPSSYTRVNRALGYMAEFMLGLYILHNNSKVKYIEMEKIYGETTKRGIRRFFKHKNFFFHVLTEGPLYFIKNFLHKVVKTKHYIPIEPAVIQGLIQDGFDLKHLASNIN